MGMSNAERQRKYRLLRDLDSDRRREYLQKCKEKYKQDKEVGKKKNVTDMTDRERRSARKKWRMKKRIARQKKKENQETLLTPPSSPESVERSPSNRQKQQSIIKKRKEIAKCYRDNRLKDEKIKDLKMKIALYKKRWQREVGASSKESPRTKTRHLLRNFSKKKVQRSLFTYNVLVQQLKQKYAEGKKKDKLRFARNISGAILRKYHLKTETFSMLGISVSRKKNKEKTCLTRRICDKVKKFYLREDNSRVITGLKKTVTKGKKKKQRHILCDNLINLHQNFLSEGKTKLSYSLFCRLRPFWVLFPSNTDRNTCLCKTCDNIDQMVTALYKADVISLDRIEKVLKEKVCDVKNHDCMYGLCNMCKDKVVPRNEKTSNLKIEWFQWKTKSEKRIVKDSKEKEITYTVKETMTDTADELFQKFSNALQTYMKHEFNKFAQYKYFKSRRDNIAENECLVHIDFSENYVCKMSEEIQSMHFGASKKQLTLHTGIMYVGESNGATFCTVSESLEHGPSAVWAHMKKVLIDIRKHHPKIVNIEFFSDGPTTQYKQKGNFFLLSVEPQEMGFKSVKWSFFESGHGKGIPDAVGGSIKREADKKVMYGEDITSAKAFVDKMKTGKTKVILVTEEEIEVEKLRLQQNTLKPVHGTLKLHQVTVRSPGKVSYRNLSCTCNSSCDLCNEPLKQANLMDQKQKKTRFQKRKLITEENVEVTKKSELNTEANSEIDKGKPTKPSTGEVRCSRDSYETYIEHKQEGSQYKESINSQNQKVNERHEIFSNLLNELNSCKTYMTLKKKCQTIDLSDYAITSQDISFYSQPDLEADFIAVGCMPDDIPSVKEICPCIVNADGNCLPSCGSVFAFGEPDSVDEIRVRIIIELVKNENKYLDDDILNNGFDASDGNVHHNSKLSLNYAQYSESFIPGTKLNKRKVQNLYRKEVMSITEDKSFMGIWQIHAMSTVLATPIYSVYPKLGNRSVRKDLNRLIYPVTEAKKDTIFIMWSSNRDDMTSEHWVPNHFVPLLTILNDEDSTDCNDDQITDGEKPMTKGGGGNNFEKDENDNFVTIYVYEKENGEYDIDFDDTTSKDPEGHVHSKETPDEKHEIFETQLSDQQELKHSTLETEGKTPTECETDEQDLEIEREVQTLINGEKTECSDTLCDELTNEEEVGQERDVQMQIDSEKINCSDTIFKVATEEQEGEPETDSQTLKESEKIVSDTVCKESTGEPKIEAQMPIVNENVKPKVSDTMFIDSTIEQVEPETETQAPIQNGKTTGTTIKESTEKHAESDREAQTEIESDKTNLFFLLGLEKTKISNKINKDSTVEQDVNQEVEVQTPAESEKKCSDTICKKSKDETNDTNNFKQEKPPELITDLQNLNSCIGKYVLVNYNKRSYPGILEEVRETSALVTCMKKAGKQKENMFIWPKRVKDCNWYDFEQIIGIIPEPSTISESYNGNRYSLNENVWNYIFLKE